MGGAARISFMRDWLVIPINLRAAKALPRNCGHRPLVGRRTLGERGGFWFSFHVIFRPGHGTQTGLGTHYLVLTSTGDKIDITVWSLNAWRVQNYGSISNFNCTFQHGTRILGEKYHLSPIPAVSGHYTLLQTLAINLITSFRRPLFTVTSILVEQ
jgi:hypothetical protein